MGFGGFGGFGGGYGGFNPMQFLGGGFGGRGFNMNRMFRGGGYGGYGGGMGNPLSMIFGALGGLGGGYGYGGGPYGGYGYGAGHHGGGYGYGGGAPYPQYAYNEHGPRSDAPPPRYVPHHPGYAPHYPQPQGGGLLDEIGDFFNGVIGGGAPQGGHWAVGQPVYPQYAARMEKWHKAGLPGDVIDETLHSTAITSDTLKKIQAALGVESDGHYGKTTRDAYLGFAGQAGTDPADVRGTLTVLRQTTRHKTAQEQRKPEAGQPKEAPAPGADAAAAPPTAPENAPPGYPVDIRPENQKRAEAAEDGPADTAPSGTPKIAHGPLTEEERATVRRAFEGKNERVIAKLKAALVAAGYTNNNGYEYGNTTQTERPELERAFGNYARSHNLSMDNMAVVLGALQAENRESKKDKGAFHYDDGAGVSSPTATPKVVAATSRGAGDDLFSRLFS